MGRCASWAKSCCCRENTSHSHALPDPTSRTGRATPAAARSAPAPISSSWLSPSLATTANAARWPLVPHSPTVSPCNACSTLRADLLARAIALRLQVVRGRPLSDEDPRSLPVLVGGPEVDPAIEAADRSFVRRRREAGKSSGHSGQEV